jgi:hypothetical protein
MPIGDMTMGLAGETIGENGLLSGTRWRIKSRGVVVDIKHFGHAPLRLVDADGRAAVILGPWGEVVMGDGRGESGGGVESGIGRVLGVVNVAFQFHD